jgi:hypothetical protein
MCNKGLPSLKTWEFFVFENAIICLLKSKLLFLLENKLVSLLEKQVVFAAPPNCLGWTNSLSLLHN